MCARGDSLYIKTLSKKMVKTSSWKSTETGALWTLPASLRSIEEIGNVCDVILAAAWINYPWFEYFSVILSQGVSVEFKALAVIV
jgi:hypothetical protein